MRMGLRALLIHKGTKLTSKFVKILVGLRALLIHKGTKHSIHEKGGDTV